MNIERCVHPFLDGAYEQVTINGDRFDMEVSMGQDNVAEVQAENGMCSDLRSIEGVYIQRFWVEPHLRNRGLGAAMLERVECWAREVGGDCVWFVLSPENGEDMRKVEKFFMVRGYKVDPESNVAVKAL